MLINCSDCGTEVSDNAKECLKCGNPITKESIEEAKDKMVEAKKAGKSNFVVWLLAALTWIPSMWIAEANKDMQWIVIYTVIAGLITFGGLFVWFIKRVKVMFIAG